MCHQSEVLVRQAEAEEADLVAEILGEAFVGDPVVQWITPNPEWSRWCWPQLAPVLLPHLEVYVTECRRGAAMWVPPGAKLNIRLRLGVLWEAWWKFGAGPIFRFVRIVRALEKEPPMEDQYHLLAVGVRAEAQGQGIGSALLGPVLQKCDQQQVGAYLESSNALNLPFYQRHGFEVRREITLPGDGPSLWLMHRAGQG